jgi:hypothetical protein
MRFSPSLVRSLLASVVLILSTASLSNGQDLSKYRSFQLGMNVDSVLAKIGMRRPDVRTIYKNPVLIQDLEWSPNEFSTQQTLSKSLSRIRFSFYDSQLYKMLVTYDYGKTNGLTTQDVIDAISLEYGKPNTPESSSVTVSAVGASFADVQTVLALWEDTDTSYSLFHGLGEPFGLLIVSKQQNTTASEAAMEAVARDRSEEAQKQTDRQAREKEDREAALEKARLLNKKNFRP